MHRVSEIAVMHRVSEIDAIHRVSETYLIHRVCETYAMDTWFRDAMHRVSTLTVKNDLWHP